MAPKPRKKPPGADLPSIARGDTPGHERDTTRAMELRAASRLRADHLGASRTAFRLRFDRVVACRPLKPAPSKLTPGAAAVSYTHLPLPTILLV